MATDRHRFSLIGGFRLIDLHLCESVIISGLNPDCSRVTEGGRRTRMPYETIEKPAAALQVRPNLSDYEAQSAAFSWEELAKELDGLPGPSAGSGRAGLDMAYEAVERHLKTKRRQKTANL